MLTNLTGIRTYFARPISRDVVGAVNISILKDCAQSLKGSIKRRQMPRINPLKMMFRYGEDILNGLEEYFQKLHSRTTLELISGVNERYLGFKNPISKKNFFLVKDKTGKWSISESPKDSLGRFSKDATPEQIHQNIFAFLEDLREIDPEIINNGILSSALKQEFPDTKTYISRVKAHKAMKKIEEYSKEIKHIDTMA